MPTKVPRVAVTLDSTAFEAVRYLALASGTSMSKVIADVIEAVSPVLHRTAEVVAAANKARDDQRQGLIAAADAAEARLRPFVLQAGMAMENALGSMERAATGGSAPAGPGADPRPDPRASNTGVRSPRGRGSKRARRKGRR